MDKFINIWSHFGAIVGQNPLKNRSKIKLWEKNTKIKKPSKTIVFTMFVEGLGLQILLKIEDFQSKYRFQNRSQSQLIFLLDF